MWYPPRPMAETRSPVRPSVRYIMPLVPTVVSACNIGLSRCSAATAPAAVLAVFTNSRRSIGDMLMIGDMLRLLYMDSSDRAGPIRDVCDCTIRPGGLARYVPLVRFSGHLKY